MSHNELESVRGKPEQPYLHAIRWVWEAMAWHISTGHSEINTNGDGAGDSSRILNGASSSRGGHLQSIQAGFLSVNLALALAIACPWSAC